MQSAHCPWSFCANGPERRAHIGSAVGREVHDFEELGMEAVWKIQVENFPAFVVVDDKGHNFFLKWTG